MEEKAKKTNIWLIISIILAVAIVGLFIWFMTTKSHLDNLLNEKEQLRTELATELDSLMSEHEMVKAAYGDLSDSLHVKDSIIQQNAKEIKRLLNTEWEYYKVKKKLSKLQTVAQGYVRQMDSLYRVNEELTQENIAMKKDIETLKDEKDEIEKVRQELTKQVEIASALRAYNIEATPVRFRTWGNKEVPTDKAKRVERIKVCFLLSENEITSSGEKDVYIRIARPDKEILTKTRDDEYTFEHNGEMLQYSIMKTVDYQNQPVDICVYWQKQYSSQELQEGLYHVDIFCDGEEIGHSTFTLR